MAEKLSDALIADLVCPPGRKDVLIFDEALTGFAIRVTRSGSKSFLLQYKFAGKARRMPIGAWPTLTTAKARRQAAAARGRVMERIDPAAERRRAEQAVAATEAAIVDCAAMLKEYPDALSARGRTAKYQKDEIGHVRHAIAAMGAGNLAPINVTPSHVDKMIAACTSGAARARFGALDRFLSWSVKRTAGRHAVAATATFERHEKPAGPAPRERVLESKDVATLWRACQAMRAGTPRDLALFLLTTPCRSGEAAAMRLRDVDLNNRVWSQPTSKNSDRHHFPLNGLALEVVERRIIALGKDPSPDALLFAGPRKGKPYSSWSNLAESVERRLKDAETSITDWEWHDTRRTFVTTLADQGIDEGLLDQILNHRASKSRGGVKRHYQFAERWEEKVEALAAWEGILRKAIASSAETADRRSTVRRKTATVS